VIASINRANHPVIKRGGARRASAARPESNRLAHNKPRSLAGADFRSKSEELIKLD
jgi:hypothetical protein